jgi:hypothetical protein
MDARYVVVFRQPDGSWKFRVNFRTVLPPGRGCPTPDEAEGMARRMGYSPRVSREERARTRASR